MADSGSGWLEAVKGLWQEFEQVHQLVGAPLAIAAVAVVALVTLWWKWDTIPRNRMSSKASSGLNRKPIRHAEPSHLTIAVMHLEGDTNKENEQLLLEGITNEFEGAESLQSTARLSERLATLQQSREPQKRRIADRSRLEPMC